jgi:hypothetical protein
MVLPGGTVGVVAAGTPEREDDQQHTTSAQEAADIIVQPWGAAMWG